MIKSVKNYKQGQSIAYIVSSKKQIESLKLDADVKKYVETQIANNTKFISLNMYGSYIYIVYVSSKDENERKESVRKAGCQICDGLKAQKSSEIYIVDLSDYKLALPLAEGIELSNYSFDKYFTKKSASALKDVKIVGKVSAEEIKNMNCLVQGVFSARDIVNEPVSYMTAEKLSEEIERIGQECGFKTEILRKKQIESLKMGGLLAVNRGSIEPPTFSILKWEPENAINEKPYVLVGKGLVFDTGGYNLKPGSSMSTMKSDKAGAAAVVGTISALAKANVPVKVYGLIPATENRIGENAYVPGDIITISDGTTIEIDNTDAEGRLILADALVYAKKLNPELVVDMATLTGAAIVAVGEQNIAILGTASKEIEKMKKCGFSVWERMIELPLWDDFADLLKSTVADMKNSGKRSAGTITAAKFLQHFTDYKWIHLDIAGPAFTEKKDSYRGLGGTSIPTRSLFKFFTEIR